MSPSEQAPAAHRRRRFRLRKPTWRGWFTIALVVAAIAWLVAWAIDYGTLGDRVARNVTIENIDLGRRSDPGFEAALRRADTRYGRGEVVFVIAGKSFPMSAGQIGLHLDTAATTAAARRIERSDPSVVRPFTWLASWFRPRRVPLTVTLDHDKLARALATLPGQTPVVEPEVVGSVDAIGTTAGESGYGFDPDRVATQIERTARDGTLPLRIPLVAETIDPIVADAEIDLLAERARRLTGHDVELTVPGATMTATPPMLRSWITTEVPDGARHARLTMDAAQVVRSARQQLGTTVTEAQPATFTVEGSTVYLVPQVDGQQCCALSSGADVLKGLQAGAQTVELPLIRVAPRFTTAAARKLGITTLLGADRPAAPQQIWSPTVGSSAPDGDTGPPDGGTTTSTTTSTTTTLPSGKAATGSGRFVVPIPGRQGQLTNVERAIPMLRGRIIMPGKQLSLNDVIGAPSPARHFVPADVATADGPTWISGGGTDLVASALFAAAYHSGLDIPTSTPHDVLPDGVQPGIDATLGWTGPDLVVANPSDHAVLVWVDRVATGVRVQLFGTPFTRAVTTSDQQLPFGPRNACLAANVTRTRELLDGKRVTDTFRARYTTPPAARDDPDRVICPS